MATELISSFMYTSTTIILGANFTEPHIKLFINQNKYNHIITVSDMEGNYENPPINCTHYSGDFNDINFWKKLVEGLKSFVVHVIVDISTAQDMDKNQWNFDSTENIASFVLALIQNGNGTFTSPCCGTGSIYVMNGKKEFEHLVYMKENREFLVDASFTKFKKGMSDTLREKNFNVNWYNNNTTPYPLQNVHIRTNSDFFVISNNLF